MNQVLSLIPQPLRDVITRAAFAAWEAQTWILKLVLRDFSNWRTSQKLKAWYAFAEVRAKAPKGNPQAVLDAIDSFGWRVGGLMCVGDRKGMILDKALRQRQPKVVIELGGFIGYSAVRIAAQLPSDGILYSVEPDPVHREIMHNILQHAGLETKVIILDKVIPEAFADLKKRGVQSFDLIFIDHLKDLYTKDLLEFVKTGFVKPGTVVVADNVHTPGSPEYRRYMETHTAEWDTKHFWTNLEYSNVAQDLVLVSEYQGGTQQAAASQHATNIKQR
jgi:catechol O-methyltransferase